MLTSVQILSVIVVSVAMAPAVAHALELPGKMRLDRDLYFAVQRIYYPGFAMAGISEPVSLILTTALLFLTPRGSFDFPLTIVALLGIIGMQVIYWVFVHPVNKIWLRGEAVGNVGSGFFSIGRSRTQAETQAHEWTRLRDRWEYGHVARAVLVGVSFIALVIVSSR